MLQHAKWVHGTCVLGTLPMTQDWNAALCLLLRVSKLCITLVAECVGLHTFLCWTLHLRHLHTHEMHGLTCAGKPSRPYASEGHLMSGDADTCAQV